MLPMSFSFTFSFLLHNICIFTCSASLLKASKGILNAVFDFKIYINMTRIQTPRVQIVIALKVLLDNKNATN